MRRDWVNNPSIMRGKKYVKCEICGKRHIDDKWVTNWMEWHKSTEHGID